MNRIYRVWTHLATVRRRGQAHGIDEVIPGRRKNSLAIRCPACPEIGFNVVKALVDHATEGEK